MEAREPVSLNAMNADGVGVRVEFAWRQDRHIHTISLLVGDRPIPVLESVEGTSVDIWPPSPPLQQLSVEAVGSSVQVALLVGMAGKSHWSISVEPSTDRAAFVFDVACRSRKAAEHLGSEYLLLADRRSTHDKHHARIAIEGRSLLIRCDRVGPTAAMVQEHPRGLQVIPESVISGGTTRWRYSIEVQ